MSKTLLTKEVVTGHIFTCDICYQRMNENEVAEVLFNDNCHICKKCRVNLPDDLIAAAQSTQNDWKWKRTAAHDFIYNLFDSEDAYDSEEDCLRDLKVGMWAVFGNNDEEKYMIENFDTISQLERIAHLYEYGYRDFPRYLKGVLRDFI